MLANYQAALHLLEEAGGTPAPERAAAVLQETARATFAPLLHAGASPALAELLAEAMGPVEPRPVLRELVETERQRIAATHSRLIRRQIAPREVAVDPPSAGDLFARLYERWA